MNPAYLVFEIRRALRDPKFLLFELSLPVALFLLESHLFGRDDVGPAYLMGSLAAFGAFRAAFDTGARTAVERGAGWQRQLRLTPLTRGGYLAAKGAVGMLTALPPIAGVAAAAAVLSGVRLPAGGWAAAVLGLWAGAVPFALLGLLVGQLATPQNVQAYQGGLLLVLAFAGGLFIPAASFPAALATVAKALPTYWLAEIAHGAAGGDVRTGTAVLVLGLYSLVLAAAVAVRFRRDAGRP
ncbi:ABC transporter permease [Microbispora corallina]|uniref:ABC transporter n=1 Tax=Microbispora corallina TaxID=83302 RepID=A0ABQ4G716_9ACTN|nr:ABC transporter permease [Microbispora corallina]GIH42868.1 ABC transporter [Microbispora corallina]